MGDVWVWEQRTGEVPDFEIRRPEMPLVKGKSKKAFDENMRTEVKAKEEQGYGAEKAQKIAAAISYAEREKSKRDRRRK